MCVITDPSTYVSLPPKYINQSIKQKTFTSARVVFFPVQEVGCRRHYGHLSKRPIFIGKFLLTPGRADSQNLKMPTGWKHLVHFQCIVDAEASWESTTSCPFLGVMRQKILDNLTVVSQSLVTTCLITASQKMRWPLIFVTSNFCLDLWLQIPSAISLTEVKFL